MADDRTGVVSEEEMALYDAIERAITDVHAALSEIDTAWVRVRAEHPHPSAGAFAALNTADALLGVARQDLARARAALADYTHAETEH